MAGLTQQEVDELLGMPKRVLAAGTVDLPRPGDAIEVELTSADMRQRFMWDIGRGRRLSGKYTLQLRYRGTIVLVRLDVGGGAHRNPEVAPDSTLAPTAGQLVATPHIHRYFEGFDDRWALPLPNAAFTQPDDMMATLLDFAEFCNVRPCPPFQEVFV